jgi:hypothetical protein
MSKQKYIHTDIPVVAPSPQPRPLLAQAAEPLAPDHALFPRKSSPALPKDLWRQDLPSLLRTRDPYVSLDGFKAVIWFNGDTFMCST